MRRVVVALRDRSEAAANCFVSQRERGLPVWRSWVCGVMGRLHKAKVGLLQGRKASGEASDEEDAEWLSRRSAFKRSAGWYSRFCKRYQLVRRKRNDKKAFDFIKYETKLARFIIGLGKLRKETGE